MPILSHDYRLVVLVVAATQRELAGFDGVVCGVGPVEAAVATARILAERKPAAVLHVGLAGMHGFGEPGVVLGSEAIYCDANVPSLVPSRAHPDAALLAAAQRALPFARIAPIGTTARVGGASGCEFEAMEGFAVLRACELAGVPALEVRAVVNEIAEPDRSLWRYDDGLVLLADVVPRLLEAFA